MPNVQMIPYAAPGRPHVGWTAPVLSYDLMRRIDDAAKELNTFVDVNVKREAFRESWKQWYGRWTDFFGKYQGTFARLGAVLSSDALYNQVLSYRSELESYQKGYAAEKDEKGNPLPSTITPVPPQPVIQEPKPLMPWWGWALMGAGVFGVSWWLYKRAERRYESFNLKQKTLGDMVKLFNPAKVAGDLPKADPVSSSVPLLLNDTPLLPPK